MATTKENIASWALIRLGEAAITAFTDDSDRAAAVAALYEPTILGLLGAYDWNFARVKASLSVDGAAPTPSHWTYGYALPTLHTTRVGKPHRVYGSTAINAPVIFDYEIAREWVFTNHTTIVITYTSRADEDDWPGYFQNLAVEALAAALALPVTENQSKDELHRSIAFGMPSELGKGGLMGAAMHADSMGDVGQSLLDHYDPITSARFGGG